MYTQCSKCETVFRLSAEALRAAGGQVRCGRCGEVFNALARLAEDATGFVKGESSLELETRADEILEATGTHETADDEALEEAFEDAEAEAHENDGDAAPGSDLARLQILNPLDEDPAAETSLEFTLPPGELDRIFVETRPNPFQRLASVIEVPPASAATTVDEAVTADGASATEISTPHGAESGPDLAASPDDPVPASPVTASPASLALRAPGAARPRGSRGSPLTRISGLEVSEDVRQEMMASYEHAELPRINTPRRRLPRAAWIAIAVALGILLIFQVLRGNREWLSVHAPLLGGSTPNLSAYQLRQWGVTGDPLAKGTLRVRASIMNTSAQLLPYPLLRVTLANRFGTRVGSREFEPAEYLGKPTARMLAPSERVDAILDILDPGKDAEGFEIDICVRDADKKILCAGDAAARPK